MTPLRRRQRRGGGRLLGSLAAETPLAERPLRSRRFGDAAFKTPIRRRCFGETASFVFHAAAGTALCGHRLRSTASETPIQIRMIGPFERRPRYEQILEFGNAAAESLSHDTASEAMIRRCGLILPRRRAEDEAASSVMSRCRSKSWDRRRRFNLGSKTLQSGIPSLNLGSKSWDPRRRG